MRQRQKHIILPIAITLSIGIASCGIALRNFRSGHNNSPLQHTVASHQITADQPVGKDAPKQSLRPAEPAWLSIPRLGVESPVAKSGLLPDGEMEAPATAELVSWYKYSYLPGSIGNAVFAGHNFYSNKPGAFNQLYILQAGDEVVIATAEHNRLTFTVTQVHQYDAEAAPVVDIFGPAKKAQIRLITCAGEWDNMKKMFGDRIIVTAEFSSESAK